MTAGPRNDPLKGLALHMVGFFVRALFWFGVVCVGAAIMWLGSDPYSWWLLALGWVVAAAALGRSLVVLKRELEWRRRWWNDA